MSSQNIPHTADTVLRPPRFAWRVDEFCEAIGISRTHFYEQLKRGEIRTIKIGKRRLVPDAERARLLEQEET